MLASIFYSNFNHRHVGLVLPSGCPLCRSTRSMSTTAHERYRCAIVGAGPGGLAAAKVMKDVGVAPLVVFEAASSVGGVWRQDGTGATWEGMRTNLAREKCELSDLAHLPSVGDFPTAVEMADYFTRYASTFGLIRFWTPTSSCRVARTFLPTSCR